MNWQKFKFVQILTSHLIKLLGTYQTCGSFNTSMGTCTPRALLLNIAKGGGKFSAWVLLCVQLRVSYWWGALTSLETALVVEKEGPPLIPTGIAVVYLLTPRSPGVPSSFSHYFRLLTFLVVQLVILDGDADRTQGLCNNLVRDPLLSQSTCRRLPNRCPF